LVNNSNDCKETMRPETRMQMAGHFAAGIAHDMNNELTLILNHLERPDIPLAQLSARRCAQLSSSLLSFCKGETLDLRRTDVSGYLTALAFELPVAPGVRIDVDFEDGLPDILVDDFSLLRVLGNLASNASDAMRGRGRILFNGIPGAIEVRDSGPGIPPEDLERIFEPFYTTKPRGTGLGLAIVKDLMRLQKGSVSVRSEPGKGTVFTLGFLTVPVLSFHRKAHA
jgi:two-component system NtrC family sensor kinase